MSQNISIKTEPLANDYKQEDSNSDTNTLSYNTIKLENFTNTGNDVKKDKLDLDKTEEFLPENDESTIDTIKEEDVDEMDEFLPEDPPSKEYVDKMDEFLPENVDKSTIDIIKEKDNEMDEFLLEDSPSIYSPSSLTWKSDDCTEAITHDEVQQQRLKTIQQISLPKLEIMDVHEDEQNSNGREANADEERSCEVSMVSNKKVGKYKCEICGRCYRQSRALVVHIRMKHPSHPEFICEICQTRFTTQHGLTRHSILKHPGADSIQTRTKHKCELCDRSYINEKSLRKHMREKHILANDTKYICEKCDIRFATKMGLVVHSSKMHLSEDHSTQTRTKHKCELCDSSYTEYKHLRAHIIAKHPSSIDADYICEICHKRFATQKGLDKHDHVSHPGASSTQTSAKYNCEICGRCYTDDIRTLRKHMRIKHPLSIDTEHICEICNLRFTTKFGLYRHCKSKH
ncbi:uncharacterized protein [Musca autumnalis]|uniref:uncharacterized protein n=1 Tax=Musca autumnalis TaxID=221902 RepID=UPI003CFBB634